MKYYWKQGDGTKIDVDKMSITHLRNVLKLIMRQSQKKPVFRKECVFKLEGDMAQGFNKAMEDDEEQDYSFLNH